MSGLGGGGGRTTGSGRPRAGCACSEEGRGSVNQRLEPLARSNIPRLPPFSIFKTTCIVRFLSPHYYHKSGLRRIIGQVPDPFSPFLHSATVSISLMAFLKGGFLITPSCECLKGLLFFSHCLCTEHFDEPLTLRKELVVGQDGN